MGKVCKWKNYGKLLEYMVFKKNMKNRTIPPNFEKILPH